MVDKFSKHVNKINRMNFLVTMVVIKRGIDYSLKQKRQGRHFEGTQLIIDVFSGLKSILGASYKLFLIKL